jgi:penicillin-binding protein 1B
VRSAPIAPGQFRRTGSGWDVFLRGFTETGVYQPARVHFDLEGTRITRLTRDGVVADRLNLDPEILMSAVDRTGEEYLPVRLGDVPLVLLQAVLAAEDHRFFEHGGLDARGLARAVLANLRAGRVTQGGSTITQQLVKNRLLGGRRTFGRKLREAWLATVLEWRYPKEQILEAYLNEVYLGQHGSLAIRGVSAAARAYFRKEIQQLDLGEAALLAGLGRAPNTYSPVLNPGRARQRRDTVLARMREVGFISAAEHDRAQRQPIRVEPTPATVQTAPYFTDLLRQELEQRFGRVVLEAPRGARIFSTLDPMLQRFAETAVTRGLERLERARPRLRRQQSAERLQAALITLDVHTGEIRALVGGRNYQASQFNRAVLAHRQPGSAFKPFVYLAALNRRRGDPAFTATSFVDDSPLTLRAPTGDWSPRNYEDRYEGRVTVRQALEHSLNAATVRIAQEVGFDSVVDAARAVGIVSPLQPVPAVALGAFEVTPIEIARAYLPLANGGYLPAALTGLSAVYEGESALNAVVDARAVMRPSESYLMTSLLQGVMTEGTGVRARALGVTGTVAGKTGTTNDGRDAWFVGYTPTLLALVWVGFDNGEPHGLSGADAALPIWADFMRQAIETSPRLDFPVPAGVTIATIDVTNGRLATRYCPVVGREVFLAGTEPAVCDEHGDLSEQLSDWWRRLRDWLRRQR